MIAIRNNDLPLLGCHASGEGNGDSVHCLTVEECIYLMCHWAELVKLCFPLDFRKGVKETYFVCPASQASDRIT